MDNVCRLVCRSAGCSFDRQTDCHRSPTTAVNTCQWSHIAKKGEKTSWPIVMYATCLGLLTLSAFKWPLVLMYPFITGNTGMPVLPLMAVGCQWVL